MSCLTLPPPSSAAPCHELAIPGIGRFGFYRLDTAHLPLIHQWVSAARASFWGMQGHTREQVAAVYTAQMASPHCQPYLLYCNGQPACLLETYDPAHDELGRFYTVQPGDCGMHFLVAPAAGAPVHGFTRAVMHAILQFLFSRPAVTRVVVEPDVNNSRIHPLNRAAGFRYLDTISLSYKTAWFAVCERHDYQTHALCMESQA